MSFIRLKAAHWSRHIDRVLSFPMATPHAAGVVALMLEANPKLTPAEVKDILQQTATNIPGLEPWEAGAGYINAYAAVDRAFQTRDYGRTVNMYREFNSNANVSVSRTPFVIDYNPITPSTNNQYKFTVPPGLTELVARVDATGILEETGNTVNLVLISPDGTEYSSGISLLFPLYYDRTVSVIAPKAGIWTAELRGLRGADQNPTDGIALPEQVNGVITFKTVASFSGLNDIDGHPAEAAIKIAVSERLVDGDSDREFRPDEVLTRRVLANYLTMGAEIRRSMVRLPSPMSGPGIDRSWRLSLPAAPLCATASRPLAASSCQPATGRSPPTTPCVAWIWPTPWCRAWGSSRRRSPATLRL